GSGLRWLTDQTQPRLEGLEVLAQARLDPREGLIARHGAQQPAGEAVQTLGEGIVRARDAQELGELALEDGKLFAQHLDLALDERDGRAAAHVRQPQPR